jgi:tetratricopeptide (TPR) repeat protein
MIIKRANLVLAVMSLIVFLLLTTIAFAENKTFIKEYTYMASDIDSKVSSRAIALEQVKRALLDQLGIYLITETEIKNYQMTKDQITTLSAGIVSAEVIDEKWDGRSYYLKAMVAADPNEVAKLVDELRNNKEKSKELEDSKKKADEARAEVERLKKDLEIVKSNKNLQEIYNKAIRELSATDFYEQGEVLMTRQKYSEAVAAYSKAIELNPNYIESFNGRAAAYFFLNDLQKAISSLDKAIEIDPAYQLSYCLTIIVG